MDLTYNLPLNEGEDNQTKLWLAVQNLTQNEIDELYQQQRPLLNGWLTISGILRNQSLSIEQQLTVFENWRIETQITQQHYPLHKISKSCRLLKTWHRKKLS